MAEEVTEICYDGEQEVTEICYDGEQTWRRK